MLYHLLHNQHYYSFLTSKPKLTINTPKVTLEYKLNNHKFIILQFMQFVNFHFYPKNLVTADFYKQNDILSSPTLMLRCGRILAYLG